MKNRQEKRHVEPLKDLEQVRDSEEEAEKVQMEIDATTFLSPLLPYIQLRIIDTKQVNELKNMKYGTSHLYL